MKVRREGLRQRRTREGATEAKSEVSTGEAGMQCHTPASTSSLQPGLCVKGHNRDRLNIGLPGLARKAHWKSDAGGSQCKVVQSPEGVRGWGLGSVESVSEPK